MRKAQTAPRPEVMATFVKSMRAIYGDPRKLTKREEQRFEQAQELERAASELEIAAAELREQAAKLRPKNMYPNSLANKIYPPLFDNSSLPKGAGVKFSFPKFGG